MRSASIIVPAYNEASVLEGSLEKILAAFTGAEVIVVNDGSTDETGQIAGRLTPRVTCLEEELNRGKGFAIRRGMLAAEGDTLVFTDADLPFGVEGIRRVVDELAAGGCDIVIAAKPAIRRGSLYRLSRVMVKALVRLLFRIRFPDTQAGLKGFRREVALAIFREATIDGFAADIEMLYIARRKGYRIRSVTLPFSRGTVRPSTFTLKQGIYLFLDIWRIRLRSYRHSSRGRQAGSPREKVGA